MPNHWHLLLWPRHDGELSEVMRWITVTHTQRWHAHRHTAGTGPVYQGRFKSFPVQTDEHFLTVARYVERNALRAKLVDRAEDWRWAQLVATRAGRPGPGGLAERRGRWSDPATGSSARIAPRRRSELEALRLCVQRGRPFGEESGCTDERSGLGWNPRCARAGVPKGPEKRLPTPFLLSFGGEAAVSMSRT